MLGQGVFVSLESLSLAAVSKHLKVLETTGLISHGRDAQGRPRHQEAARLREVFEWLETFQRFWDETLVAFKAAAKREAAKERKPR